MIRYLYLKLCKILFLFRSNFESSIRVGRGVGIKGLPILDLKKGSTVLLGENVTLNSSNRKYHINMHSPVKLYTSQPGAKIEIGNSTRVHGSCIHAQEEIVIGANCLIAANSQIMDGNGHDAFPKGSTKRIDTIGKTQPVCIEDDVWIGSNVTILPGTHIGKGSVVSAGSVVSGRFPENSLIMGNPAKRVEK